MKYVLINYQRAILYNYLAQIRIQKYSCKCFFLFDNQNVLIMYLKSEDRVRGRLHIMIANHFEFGSLSITSSNYKK